jgi:hypothetical protein
MVEWIWQICPTILSPSSQKPSRVVYGDTLDLYSERAQYESRQGHTILAEVYSWFSSVPPDKCCDILWIASVCIFLQPPIISSILSHNILLSTLFLDTHAVRNQVLHKPKLQEKLWCFIYYSLRFYTVDEKTQFSELNGSKHYENLILIFPWLKFSFVTGIPKYFNFATFSDCFFSLYYDFALHSGGETPTYTSFKTIKN